MLNEKQYRAAVRILKAMGGKSTFRTWWDKDLKGEFAEVEYSGIPVVEGVDKARELATIAIAIGGQCVIGGRYRGLTEEVVVDARMYVATNRRVLTADGDRVEDEDCDELADRVIG
jgi:hypothetical protein